MRGKGCYTVHRSIDRSTWATTPVTLVLGVEKRSSTRSAPCSRHPVDPLSPTPTDPASNPQPKQTTPPMPAATSHQKTPRGGSGSGHPTAGAGSSHSAVLEGMYTGGLPAEVTAAVQAALPTSDPLDRPVRVLLVCLFVFVFGRLVWLVCLTGDEKVRPRDKHT